MAPKESDILMTALTISSAFLDLTKMGMPFIPTNCSKRTDLPSITGRLAIVPMFPKPRTAVPLVTIATVLFAYVYLKNSPGDFIIFWQMVATPGVYIF